MSKVIATQLKKQKKYLLKTNKNSTFVPDYCNGFDKEFSK